MNRTVDRKRRAKRLLRWYPSVWQERYGDEFVEHLEQEFTDRPFDFKRTLNVARNGLIARVGDLGLTATELGCQGQSRAAMGTSFTLIAITSVLTLNYWSLAVGRWSSRRYHPLPDTIATGILTVTAGLLVLMLVAIVFVVVVSAARQIKRDRARTLTGPSLFAIASGSFVLYAARRLPMQLVEYTHSPHLRPAIQWSHPGSAIAALAQSTWDLTQTWVSLWTQRFDGIPMSQAIVNDLLPIAILAFGVSIALLIRRVELPSISERTSSAIVALMGMLLGGFLLAYLVWFNVGGPSGSNVFSFEGGVISKLYIVFATVVAVLVGRSGYRLARRNHLMRRWGNSEVSYVA
ncbi:MAG: hypothetical protein WCF25_07845 [Acidimicrobiales bacterium]